MRRILAALILLLAVSAAPAAAAERRVPRGWLGVTVDGPVSPYKPGEWNRMAGAGVETVRVGLRWNEIQPYPPGRVPRDELDRFRDAGGVPTDFSRFDAMVAAASARHIAVLPVVHLAPSWLALNPHNPASPAADPAALGRFFSVVVARYGPDGSYWREHPRLPRMPIRAWQVWNEPSLAGYWSEQPFAPSFVAALRAAASSIRAADRGATVVLAGLPGKSWVALRQVYAAGGRGLFDAVALHPYTRRPRDVLRIIRYARREMRANGDGELPIWVTELSWPASRRNVRDPIGIEVTESGQAARVRVALRMLAAARTRLRIERVLWYTWLSKEGGRSVFDWSGLRRVRDGKRVSAPALAAFRRVARRLEGCRKARADALHCA
jgi:hypothetical protein